MRLKGLVYVILKLFAIYLIVKGIEHVLGGTLFLSLSLIQKKIFVEPEWIPVTFLRPLILIEFFAAVFLFGMAHYILSFTPKIVNYIFAADNEIDEKNRQIKANDFKRAAFTITGFFIISHAVLILSARFERILMKATLIHVKEASMGIDNLNTWWSFDTGFSLKIMGHLAYLIIGIALIIWGKQLATFISKINPGAVTLARRLRLLQESEKPGKTSVEEIQTG